MNQTKIMRRTVRWAGIALATLFVATVTRGQVPQMINYQGRISSGMTGPGYFTFAFVDSTKATAYWSNDGTWVLPPGATVHMPSTPVHLDLKKGLYSVMLGNPPPPPAPLLPMGPILPSVFQNPIVYLRVWFSENLAGPYDL